MPSFDRLRALALLLVSLACSKQETRALVPIDIELPADSELTEVVAKVVRDGATLASRRLDGKLARGATLAIGIYLPASVAGGPVDVTATGRGRNNDTFTSGPAAHTTISAGQLAALVTLVLKPETQAPAGGGSPDAGSPDSGDTGKLPDAGGPDLAPDAGVDATAPATGWGPLVNVEKDQLAKSQSPLIAIHPSEGHVLVAWRDDNDTLKVMRHDAGTALWSPAKVIDSRVYSSTVASLVFAANGHAMLVWNNDPNAAADTRGVWSSRSTDSGRTWSLPLRIHDGPARDAVSAAITQEGVVRVAWEEAAAVNEPSAVWSALFAPTTGTWDRVAAVAAPTNVAGDRKSRLVMDASGAGFIAFVDAISMVDISYRVWAYPFTGVAPIANGKLLASNKEGYPYLAAAMAPGGRRGVALLVEAAAQGEALFMHELESGAWRAPTLVLNASAMRQPALVIDDKGVTTAAWAQALANGGLNVVAARHTPDQGWSAPAPLETTNVAQANDAVLPDLGVDAQGTVHATWRRRTVASGSAPAIVRTWRAGAWQPEILFNVKKDQIHLHPRIAVATTGAAAMATTLYGYDGSEPDDNAFNVHVTLLK